MTVTLAFRAILLLVLCALLAAASGLLVPMRVSAGDAPNAAREATLEFGGRTRTYRLYRPSSLDRNRAVPLVLVLHGGFGSAAQAERAYRWDETADAHGFVALYPDGIARSWNAGTCCGRSQATGIDDAGFLQALLETITSSEHIDCRRIYVTGMSNGAMLAYKLACDSRIPLAAIGPVAGTLVTACEHAHPTSVLAIHGLADRNVPYQGGSGEGYDRSPRMSVPETLKRWRDIDNCDAPAAHEDPPIRDERAQCPKHRTVELVTITGAGHQWPGSHPPPPAAAALLHLDQPSQALNATEKLWTFFAAHSAE